MASCIALRISRAVTGFSVSMRGEICIASSRDGSGAQRGDVPTATFRGGSIALRGEVCTATLRSAAMEDVCTATFRGGSIALRGEVCTATLRSAAMEAFSRVPWGEVSAAALATIACNSEPLQKRGCVLLNFNLLRNLLSAGINGSHTCHVGDGRMSGFFVASDISESVADSV